MEPSYDSPNSILSNLEHVELPGTVPVLAESMLSESLSEWADSAKYLLELTLASRPFEVLIDHVIFLGATPEWQRIVVLAMIRSALTDPASKYGMLSGEHLIFALAGLDIKSEGFDNLAFLEKSDHEILRGFLRLWPVIRAGDDLYPESEIQDAIARVNDELGF